MFELSRKEKNALVLISLFLFIGFCIGYIFRPQKKNIPEKVVKNFETFKIDINKATEEELVNLSGIGPALAQRIISYREKHGNFTNMEDIRQVKGIGAIKYEKIKKYIKV